MVVFGLEIEPYLEVGAYAVKEVDPGYGRLCL